MKLDSPYFAAVDLGSNSFHMIIARIDNGQMEIVDREKEMVQLARGIKADGHLSVAAQNRALECLTRFAERLRDIPSEQVRAVGTKALRSTRKASTFIRKAEKIIGTPIQIISGYEEARLVYAGLSHSVRNDLNHRLVVDIGGGSTECIIGLDYEPIILESLSVGCVTFTERYMKQGKPGKRDLQRVYLTACAELEGIRQMYLRTGWRIVYGTSGTARAIADLVVDRDGGAVISKASLDWLAEEIFRNKTLLGSVAEPRSSVLPAGIAILRAVFDQLNVEVMHVSDYALKEGLLYDTIGRLSDQDSRKKTVKKLQEHYKVDIDQAARVADTALYLWKQIDGPILLGVSRSKILRWAAQLHEIGLSISHSGHHHHGYYLLRHGDIAGFGRYEQYMLANLVRSHRKGLYQEKFGDMDDLAIAAFVPLLVCLRLSTLLHRRREDLEQKQLPKLIVSGNTYTLKFPRGWLKKHPLTLAGMELEKEQYDRIGVELEFR
ncbi:MAG: Ppx/GppA family phosphatase [Gammaproteobacteria bacterium]|nr:Ppx/GppA family phosphatase [Gammaproteobacteria bacterium]